MIFHCHLCFRGVPRTISLPDTKTRTVLFVIVVQSKWPSQTFCFEYEKLSSGLYTNMFITYHYVYSNPHQIGYISTRLKEKANDICLVIPKLFMKTNDNRSDNIVSTSVVKRLRFLAFPSCGDAEFGNVARSQEKNMQSR